MTRAFFEELPCALSAAEKLMKGNQLVDRLAEKAEVVLEKKEATSELNGRIKEIDKVVNKLAQEVRTGKEYREVECYERLDFADGKVEVLRSDTGEVWRTRPMRPDERQEPLPIPGASATAVPPKRRAKAKVDLDAAAAGETKIYVTGVDGERTRIDPGAVGADNDNADEDDEFKRGMQ